MTLAEKTEIKKINRALYDGNLGEDLTGIPDYLVADEMPFEMYLCTSDEWKEEGAI